MVKNSIGGNKAKGLARKYVNEVVTTILRLSTDDYELYGKVVKLLGNNMCDVLCNDGITRLCYIRGKFRGRNKKSNLVGINTWVLVGLRDYEKMHSDTNASIKNCDLLEIYSEDEKERLKNADKTTNWRIFADTVKNTTTPSRNDTNKIVIQDYSMMEQDDNDFAFVDDDTYNLHREMEITASTNKPVMIRSSVIKTDDIGVDDGDGDDEMINVDDI